MEEIFVQTIYCDDVRQEVGGKQSFMGVYNSDLIVPEFPMHLLKLCAHITVRFPSKSEAKSLVLGLKTSETTLVEIPLPDGDLQKMRIALTQNKDDSRFFSAVIGLQLTPFQLDQPTTLHTIATVDGKEIKGPGLRIRLPNDTERAGLQVPQVMPS